MVNDAIKDLEHCRAFKKVGNNQPSCIEEKKNLEKARARLANAEEKAEAVRRWTPVVLQQYRETCVRLVHFREVVDVDCPKAMANIERMLKAARRLSRGLRPTALVGIEWCRRSGGGDPADR